MRTIKVQFRPRHTGRPHSLRGAGFGRTTRIHSTLAYSVCVDSACYPPWEGEMSASLWSVCLIKWHMKRLCVWVREKKRKKRQESTWVFCPTHRGATPNGASAMNLRNFVRSPELIQHAKRHLDRINSFVFTRRSSLVYTYALAIRP